MNHIIENMIKISQQEERSTHIFAKCHKPDYPSSYCKVSWETV